MAVVMKWGTMDVEIHMCNTSVLHACNTAHADGVQL